MRAKAVNPRQTQAAPNIAPADSLLQRKCSCGQHTIVGASCDACKSQPAAATLRRNAANSSSSNEVPPVVYAVLNSPGQPLDRETRSFFERRFDHDFSQVRVHADASAADSARTLNALAYTVGQNLVFGSGQFAPHTGAGRSLLAHELTHVTQTGNITATSGLKIGAADSAEEHAAERNETAGGAAHGRISADNPRLYRKGGSLGGFFANIGRGIANIFTKEERGYPEQTLKDYLKSLADTKDIEDDYDSDNKARAVVRLWKGAKAAFSLSPELKILLIREMQSGATLDDDEQAILDLLEYSKDGDLRIIFGTGGINVKDLNGDFHGAEWKRLQAFYARRFDGGMSALLQGKVEPIGAPVAGAPKFPYNWTALKAKLNGPYPIPEIVADLNGFTEAERDQALKDIGTERTRLDRSLRDPLRSLAEKYQAESDPAKKELLKKQSRALQQPVRRLDEILQTVFKDIALEESAVSLAGKTTIPTAAEKAEIAEALKPDRKKDAAGLVLPFTPKLPGETKTYEDKLRELIPGMIQGYYDSVVVGKGPTEHKDPTKTHPLKKLENIGNVSKDETDAVFDGYYDKSAHPPLKADQPGTRGNIHDLFQDTEDRLAVMNTDQKKALAKALMIYFFQSNREVGALNYAHSADPSFSRDARSLPLNDEAKSLEKLARENTTTPAQVKKLNEIDRGWVASAGGQGDINIQIFKKPTPDEDRDFLWDMFQTLIHEYIHTLADDKYNTFAESFGGDKSNEFNTLVEGVDSLLDEVVWTNIAHRVKDPNLREKVEGPENAKLPPIDVRPASRRRYPSYPQAVNLVNIVGIRNLYAAYFMGQTDKLGG